MRALQASSLSRLLRSVQVTDTLSLHGLARPKPPAAALLGLAASRRQSSSSTPTHAHASTPANHAHHAHAVSDVASPPPPSASAVPLPPSQVHILLPQLSPRMEHGRVVRWLLREGEELKPHQVFMHVETHELTEDGSRYLLEVESHESGVLRRILVPAEADSEGRDSSSASSAPLGLPVGTPVGLFEDPDWTEGDPPRGEFLWQAYVMQGQVQRGSCAPQRGGEPEAGAGAEAEAKPDDATVSATPAKDDAPAAAVPPATKARKPRAPSTKKKSV